MFEKMGGSGKDTAKEPQANLALTNLPGSAHPRELGFLSEVSVLPKAKNPAQKLQGVQEFSAVPQTWALLLTWEQTAAPARGFAFSSWFYISSGLLPFLWGQVGFGGPVPALRCHLSGEAKDCSWILLQSSQTAPGTLMLPLSRQVSASGLFLFLKYTENVFLPVCSDSKMCIPEAPPFPSTTILAHWASSREILGCSREEKGPHPIFPHLHPPCTALTVSVHRAQPGSEGASHDADAVLDFDFFFYMFSIFITHTFITL